MAFAYITRDGEIIYPEQIEAWKRAHNSPKRTSQWHESSGGHMTIGDFEPSLQYYPIMKEPLPLRIFQVERVAAGMPPAVIQIRSTPPGQQSGPWAFLCIRSRECYPGQPQNCVEQCLACQAQLSESCIQSCYDKCIDKHQKCIQIARFRSFDEFYHGILEKILIQQHVACNDITMVINDVKKAPIRFRAAFVVRAKADNESNNHVEHRLEIERRIWPEVLAGRRTLNPKHGSLPVHLAVYWWPITAAEPPPMDPPSRFVRRGAFSEPCTKSGQAQPYVPPHRSTWGKSIPKSVPISALSAYSQRPGDGIYRRPRATKANLASLAQSSASDLTTVRDYSTFTPGNLYHSTQHSQTRQTSTLQSSSSSSSQQSPFRSRADASSWRTPLPSTLDTVNIPGHAIAGRPGANIAGVEPGLAAEAVSVTTTTAAVTASGSSTKVRASDGHPDSEYNSVFTRKDHDSLYESD